MEKELIINFKVKQSASSQSFLLLCCWLGWLTECRVPPCSPDRPWIRDLPASVSKGHVAACAPVSHQILHSQLWIACHKVPLFDHCCFQPSLQSEAVSTPWALHIHFQARDGPCRSDLLQRLARRTQPCHPLQSVLGIQSPGLRHQPQAWDYSIALDMLPSCLPPKSHQFSPSWLALGYNIT